MEAEGKLDKGAVVQICMAVENEKLKVAKQCLVREKVGLTLSVHKRAGRAHAGMLCPCVWHCPSGSVESKEV